MSLCKEGMSLFCMLVHMPAAKFTSTHVSCRAQNRGGDVSSPARNNLAVLSVQSIACCSNQVGTGAVLVVCITSSKTLIACSANIADNASCTLVHALLLAAWRFGHFVTVISAMVGPSLFQQWSVQASKKTFQVGQDECIAVHIRLFNRPIAMDVGIHAQSKAKQMQCCFRNFAK